MRKNIVGIDLGTSNITLSYGEIKEKTIEVLPLSQVLKVGQMHKQKYLPASILIHSEKEQEKMESCPGKKGSRTSAFTLGTLAQKTGSRKA